MAIHEAKLPFKPGYVEVEVDDRRTYKNAKTGILIENETYEPTAQDDTDALMVDHELRLTLLELGV